MGVPSDEATKAAGANFGFCRLGWRHVRAWVYTMKMHLVALFAFHCFSRARGFMDDLGHCARRGVVCVAVETW